MNGISAAQSIIFGQDTGGLDDIFRDVNDKIVGPIVVQVTDHSPIISA